MLTINIALANGFSATQMAKVTLMSEQLQLAFNSDKFKSSVLNFVFDGEKTFYFRKTLLENISTDHILIVKF